MSFEQLDLIKPLVDAVRRKGYTTPTPIQQQSIPHILNGSDIFGCAQTGTGKTAAFALPLLQILTEEQNQHIQRGIKVLILAPTRELVQQINESFAEYGRGTKIRHTSIYGGVSQRTQVTILKKGVDVVIATPGRLQDLVQQGFIKLDTVRHFVLDEADRISRPQVQSVAEVLPEILDAIGEKKDFLGIFSQVYTGRGWHRLVYPAASAPFCL